MINVGFPRFSRVVSSKRQSSNALKFGEISSFAVESAKIAKKKTNTTVNFIVSNENEVENKIKGRLIKIGDKIFIDNIVYNKLGMYVSIIRTKLCRDHRS